MLKLIKKIFARKPKEVKPDPWEEWKNTMKKGLEIEMGIAKQRRNLATLKILALDPIANKDKIEAIKAEIEEGEKLIESQLMGLKQDYVNSL